MLSSQGAEHAFDSRDRITRGLVRRVNSSLPVCIAGYSIVAGYSGTPLAKKLGIQAGAFVRAVDAPDDYAQLLEPLPANVTFVERGADELDMVHLFTKSRSKLVKYLDEYKKKIKQNGSIWVSWPKRSSGIPSEVTEDTIREVALPLGLVDVKVCAVDDTWSGLKLVIRKENRV
jgi:Protein of unknown function (DUF3052)